MLLFLIDKLVFDIKAISDVLSTIFLFCVIVFTSLGPNQK